MTRGGLRLVSRAEAPNEQARRREALHQAAMDVCFALEELKPLGLRSDPLAYTAARAAFDNALREWERRALEAKR